MTTQSMNDLIEVNVVQLHKSEIKLAYADNETSKKICAEVSTATSKTKSLRSTVRETLSKLSSDGTSQSNLYDIELAMNNLKVQNKIDQMKVLKATIEYCYNELVNDETQPYFVKENRKSMKNVTINDQTPCVLSEVLPPKGRKKDITTSSVDDSDIILNLSADDENEFASKNKILFQKMTDLNEKNELVVDDDEFEYTFYTLVENFIDELLKARKNAELDALEKEVDEIIEKVA